MDIDERPKPVKHGATRGLEQHRSSARSTFPAFSGLSGPILYSFCTGLFAAEGKDYMPKKKVRLTFAPGADVLPVFSPDGKKLMWTSTRDGRGPAQLYIADFVPPKED
jgi:Tol biopolymer transport system component